MIYTTFRKDFTSKDISCAGSNMPFHFFHIGL